MDITQGFCGFEEPLEDIFEVSHGAFAAGG
jgi:hypothetical protein